jgi:3-oxoacyl-[acyl-carrier protein] reductase
MRLLLFGASGAIGSAIGSIFQTRGWSVVNVSRNQPRAEKPDNEYLCVDPFDATYDPATFDRCGPYDAVVWAQGKNLNDSVYSVSADDNLDMYRANCLFIAITLKDLLERRLLAAGARLCVISSIWQSLARQNKLSYCMTKAALQGLVTSAAADLGKDGYFINAILPGALDTPMTRQNLSPAQLERLQSATLFNRLPTLEDVGSLAYFLCSEANTGITGQFIAADLGFSHVRIL